VGRQFCNDHLGKHDGFREPRNDTHKTLDVLKSMVNLLSGIKIDAIRILGNSRRLHRLRNIGRKVLCQSGITSNATQQLGTRMLE